MSSRAGTRLVFAFCLLIGLQAIVAWLALDRMQRIENGMGGLVQHEWAKAKLARQALAFSAMNNRITLQVFLMDNPKDLEPLLAQRAQNTKQISTLLGQIGKRVTSLEEERLLATVKKARKPYVDSYIEALKLRFEEKKYAEAHAAMMERTIPLLIKYHDSWNKFVEFQGRQMDAEAGAAERNYAATRKEMLYLTVLALAGACAVALFVTRAAAHDAAERLRAEQSLQQARSELEIRVVERTNELQRKVIEHKETADALAEAGVRRRILIEQSKDGVVVLDLDGKVHEFNPSFTRMLGYSPSEMQQMHVWDWDAQWTREEVLAKLREFGMESVTFETKHRRKDGSYYDVEVSASGAVCGGQTLLYCVHRDISDRKAAERGLRERQAKLDTILRAAPAGIGVVANRVLVEVNAMVCQMSGYSAEELLGKPIRPLYASEEDYLDAAHVYEWLKDHATHRFETRWRSKEGAIIHILYCVSMIAPNDPSQGVVFTALDITERKTAEAELERVHKELMDASRQAGMAEVATSVLHNVGNVFNSINVSTAVISEQVKKSKGGHVAKVAALMEQHAADLGDFMSGDAKGRQLPGFLKQLAEHLDGEKTFMLNELGQLSKNMEHVKDIIAMQQSYAKVSGLVETVKVPDLIDDALRINASALMRHDVQFFREYGDHIPEITVEKHKVLQVLVNLIRNAKYACDESGREDKRLTLRVTNGGDAVRIALMDNGIGIPPENLERIFNHGFTTRKDGHGFGLHSGALAAKEMGGSLIAESEGPGKGATFTLELPCNRKANAS